MSQVPGCEDPVVPVLRSAVLLDAPLPTVAAALRDVGVLQRAAAGHAAEQATGHIAGGSEPVDADPQSGAGRLLGTGDEVALQVQCAPGIRLPMRLRATSVALDRLGSTLVAGPPARLAHTGVLAATAGGTLLTTEIDWACPGGRAVDVLVSRRLVRTVLGRHQQQISARAAHLAAAAEVAAAAVLGRHGRVLVQQRARPAAMAGRWELPGGQVEPGESARDALVRECHEELAVTVVPGAQLGPDVPLPGGRVLRVYRAALAEPGARPVAVEHAALRWVAAAELTELDWLDADRVVLPDLELALRAG
ncbi:MAG: NUDIX domain-containing protein [Pseudonocardiaceae bacterium]